MKHSVTRDFRIKNPELVEGLEKMDASMVISVASNHKFDLIARGIEFRNNINISSSFPRTWKPTRMDMKMRTKMKTMTKRKVATRT